jgi:CRISPR system Cascade subunit CasA
MLVTAKNHDVKAARLTEAGIDDWLFALVTLQTMEGIGGRNNYGVSRMNGGFANRPGFSIAPPHHGQAVFSAVDKTQVPHGSLQ